MNARDGHPDNLLRSAHWRLTTCEANFTGTATLEKRNISTPSDVVTQIQVHLKRDNVVPEHVVAAILAEEL